jgi:hypothetical protein
MDRQSYKEGFRKKDSISPSDTIIKATKSEESIFRKEIQQIKLIKRTNLLLCMIRQNSIIKIELKVKLYSITKK